MPRMTRLLSIILIVALSACGDPSQNPEVKSPSPSASSDTPIEAIDKFIAFWSRQEGGFDKSKAGWRLRLMEPEAVEFPEGRRYFWLLETSKGPLKLELFPRIAPRHVASTIFLTRLGYYDNLAFHRIIPGFMAQGGCPLGTGTGSPGYAMDGEFDRKVRHDRRGRLSMANSGPGTDGSQFFITFGPTSHLDGKHTIFGQLVEGERTLIKIENMGTSSGTPRRPVLIKKATILTEDG